MLNHQKAPQCPYCTKRLSYIRQRKIARHRVIVWYCGRCKRKIHERQ